MIANNGTHSYAQYLEWQLQSQSVSWQWLDDHVRTHLQHRSCAGAAGFPNFNEQLVDIQAQYSFGAHAAGFWTTTSGWLAYKLSTGLTLMPRDSGLERTVVWQAGSDLRAAACC